MLHIWLPLQTVGGLPCNLVLSSIQAEEHAEDYLRELNILREKVPELQNQNLELRAEGSRVSLSRLIYSEYIFIFTNGQFAC